MKKHFKKYVIAATVLVLAFVVLLYKEKTDVVAFGDSNTANSNWQNQGYDSLGKWVTKLQADHILIANEGVGGNTTVNAKHRVIQDVLLHNPKQVYIMFGTNDAVIETDNKPAVSKEDFRKNIQTFVNLAKTIGAEPVLMTTIPLIEGNGADGMYYARHDAKLYEKVKGAKAWHDSYNDIIRELAVQNNVKLIDNWKRFIEAAGGVDDKTLISSGLIDNSGTHMTLKGAELIYKEISQAK